MLSFPFEGITLAIDFPNKGETTLKMLEKIDSVILDAGGRLYPAKDARMKQETFLKVFQIFMNSKNTSILYLTHHF